MIQNRRRFVNYTVSGSEAFFFDISESNVQNDLLIQFIYETVKRHSYSEQQSWDCAEPWLAIDMVLLRGDVRICVACKFVELRGIAVQLRENARNTGGFHVRGIPKIRNPQNAWKCAEPRIAWKCGLRVCIHTAA